VPTRLVAQVLCRHLRLPAGWDDAERREFIDEAAEQVALRVAELADDWADRASQNGVGSTGDYPILILRPSWSGRRGLRRW
jgi:hypothetical protein